MTARSATPIHCPFCGDEDLRPVEDESTAWACRFCARVFTVALVRIDHAGIPANRTAAFGPVSLMSSISSNSPVSSVDPVGSATRDHGGRE